MEKLICPVCNKEFKKLYALNAHITNHKQKELYPDGINCPICNTHVKSLKGFYKHCTIKHSSLEDSIFIYRELTKDNKNYFCENCNKPALFISISKGFAHYCSEECRSIIQRNHYEEAIKNIDYSKIDYSKALEQRKKTNFEIYGYDNAAKAPEVKARARKTCEERHGGGSSMCSPLVQEKAKATYREKYGKDWGLSAREVIEKRIDNLQKEKGVSNVFQLDSVKEKIKRTHLENRGYDNPSKDPSVKDKKKNTYTEHFGVDHPAKTKWFHEKIRETSKDKYGKDHYFQTEEFKLRYRETSLRNWGTIHPSLAEEVIAKKQNTNLERYNTKEVLANKDIRKQIQINCIKNYGVSNFYQTETSVTNRLKTFHNKVIEKYKKEVKPLFSFEEWKDSNNRSSLEWECMKCNKTIKGYLYCGHPPRCLNCYPILHGFSKMEKEVEEFLSNYISDIDTNSRKIIGPREIDIFIPKYNLAIEFDGLFWHSELNNTDKNYHLSKTQECLSKNIKLIHIFENEWLNKREIVESILLNNVGVHSNKIGARQCIVKEVSSKEAFNFYEENHIQGSNYSSFNLGLYHNNELVSCLSFSKPRFNKNYEWELTRFANKLNTKVMGSFSKLWERKPKGSIISYSDKRYFTGEIYKKYMIQKKDSAPAYWYFDKSGNLESRVNYQKHKLEKLLPIFDSKLSEWENMKNNGYNRIWDCGNYVFEYIE